MKSDLNAKCSIYPMGLKKSPKADIESQKDILFLLGLVMSLLIVLISFKWTTKAKQIDSLGIVQEQIIEEEMIPITREEVKPPPPPKPKIVEVLTIVEDEVEIEEELEIEDTEADEETIIDVEMVIVEEEEEETVFVVVEEMPEFPGGELALRKYIAQSIEYPIVAQESGLEGKVYINFVVDKNGKVTNAKILRGIHPSLDQEALRVINNLPKWKPGRQRGQAVNVSYTVPINFVLQ
jgi:protein TonB